MSTAFSREFHAVPASEGKGQRRGTEEWERGTRRQQRSAGWKADCVRDTRRARPDEGGDERRHMSLEGRAFRLEERGDEERVIVQLEGAHLARGVVGGRAERS